MVLRPEENASRRQFQRQRLNRTKLVLSQHLRAWRQLFELVDMRAESVEDGKPRRETQVGAAGRRGGNRSRHPEFAAAGIAADVSSAEHHFVTLRNGSEKRRFTIGLSR